MATSRDINTLLGPALFSSIPTNTQVVLQQAWTAHTADLRTQLEKLRVDSEQKVFELERKNEDLNKKNASFNEEAERGQSSLVSYREQATKTGSVNTKLTEENISLAAERDGLRRQLDTAKAERDDLAGLSERRQGDIERLHGDLKNMTEQLGQANNARCEAQVKVEEVESKEVNLAYREKRLEEEREFFKSQISMLQTEVEKRSEEVLQARRESGQELARINQELSEQMEEARAAKRGEESSSGEADSYKRRAEELAERLREARESESKLEENYRAELRAQTKLANLYKSHSDEYNNKTEELSNAVTELQSLLSDSSDKYGRLEEKLLIEEAKNKDEVAVKVEANDALRKELEEANKLIKTFKTKGLTEEGIECLSPSAAAASRMLKSGVTITGIYSQMVNLSEELAVEKEENKRLNLYLDQILLEIEERAPMLKQQREDYERAVGAVGGLTEQLEAAREEAELRRGEAEEYRRGNASLEKDRNRLETMVQDLGKQVTVLVREVEESRTGHRRLRSEASAPLDTSSADSVIDCRLLTYLDVSELQQRNIELLAVVRELSAGQEASEAKLVEERTAEVRQELDTALRQVEELRSARERQSTMVESIIQQRDMYKSMCSGGSVASPTAPSKLATPKQLSPRAAKLAQDAEKKGKEVELELAEVKKDFAEYKEEKAVNDKMSNEQLEKMREDLMEARSNASKLASQEEYNTERFKILQTNATGYKKNMEALEERNRQLHSIAAKHEASVTSLRNEILGIQSKMSRAEVQVDHLNHEKSVLQSSEARLLAEREVLHREKSSSARIVANLQQIQLNLERGEEEGKARLQHLNENLQKEAELLRKRLEGEQDQYRDSVRAWEGTNRELREKVEAATAAEKAALEQMTSVSQTIETLKEELRDTSEQLQLAESRLAGRGQVLSSQSSVVEGQKGTGRLRDVELLLAQTRQEMKSVKDQLADSKKQAEQYKGIAGSCETRMVETNNTMAEFKKEMEVKLEQAREEREAAEKKAGEMQVEYKEMEQKVENLEAEVGASGGELKGKLKATTTELAELKRKLKVSEKVEKEARLETEKLSKSLFEAQESYERELLMHAKDVEIMNQLKTKVSAHQSELDNAKEAKRKAEDKLSKDRTYKDKQIEKIKNKSSTTSEQLDLISKQNAALHKQLESMSQKMADMSAAGLNTSGGGSNVNTSLNVSDVNKSINEDEASNDQLVAIIRYLRKEKEIIASRFEVLQAESARTESQLEHHQKVATDSQNALDQERQSNSQASLSGSKHAELIRKVETLSAITDSNRLLREELQRLEGTVGDSHKKANDAEEAVKPLEIKLREVEERASNLAVEKAALQTESDKWKQRANQLIEKSHKVNPDELKKLQESRTQLGKMVTTLKKEKEALEEKSGSQGKELEAIKGKHMATQQETKRLEKEIQEKNTENNKLSMASVTAKNATANLSKSVNDQKRKIEELEKEKNDAKSALQAAAAKHRQEIIEAKKDADQSKSGQEEANKIKKELTDSKEALTAKEQELEQLKKDSEDKTEQLNKLKNNNVQLKKIGRNFREKLTLAETENNKITEEKTSLDAAIQALKEEKKKLEEDNEKLKSSNQGENIGANDDSASGRAGDADSAAQEAEALIAQSAAEIESMTNELDEIKAENDALKTKMAEKEERAKKVLTNAKTKIQKVELENKELQKKLTASSEGAGELQSQVSQTEEMDAMKAAFGAQINALKTAKEKAEEAKSDEIKEKERLMEEVEKLQQELTASQLSNQQQQERGERSKPVAVVGVVPQPPQPRKQAQPQAHIQPQRHQSRDEHRHAQTANVRPMAMRSSSQAVVLPTSQGTSQPEVATVPPTVSVSPSVSAPQIPSTSQPQQQLDPAAQEFFPTPREGSSEAREVLEEPPRAVVTPRQDQPQSSTSGPTHQPAQAQPSTSTAVNTQQQPTTASVQPTLKRPRETPDSDSQSSADERVSGPSGFQKKPRTTSSTEMAASGSHVSSAGAEDMLDAGVSGSGELEMDSSIAQDLGAFFDVEDPSAGPGESEIHGGVVASSMEDDGGEEMAASSAGRSGISANSSSAISGSNQPASSAAGLAASSTTHDDEDNDEVVVLDSENDDDMEEGEVMSCHDDQEEPNLDGDDEQVYDAEEDDVDEVAEDDEDDDGDEGNVTAGDDDDNGVVEVVDSEDEAEPSREQVQEANGDNSSEPSSSTGAGQQRFRPGHSTAQGGMGYGEDQGDDSVVPSTPKLILPRRNDGGFAEAVSSPQVPSSDRFTFGAGASGSSLSGPDVIVTSSNSGLAGQEGVDRTAVDISQFASGGAGARTVPNTPQTTSPEQPEMGVDLQSEMAETLDVALDDDPSDDAVPEIHIAGDSEEGGVSSSGSAPSSQQDARHARTRERIVWGEAGGAPPASTSPVRGGAQVPATSNLFRGEGSASTRAMARRSRGGPFSRRGQQ